MENVKNAQKKEEIKNLCHDCGKEIKEEGGKLKNGVFLVYDDCGEKVKVLKCKGCFKKSKILSNFKRCEVYSRVVGYIRPVQQWNIGKKQEYSEREEFSFN